MKHPRTEHRSLNAVTTAVVALCAATGAHATCTETGTFLTTHCGTDYVQYLTDTGTATLTVNNHTTVSVELTPHATSSGPYQHTLNVTGTTVVNNPSYSGLISQTNMANRDIEVFVDPTVSITAGPGGFGGIWVRNDTSGNIRIESGATVQSSGNQDGINSVTNLGNSAVVNTGSVTSLNYRGLYSENGDSGHVGSGLDATIVNDTGAVTNAFLATARAINYNGLAEITNRGTLTSTTRQGAIAWAEVGTARIVNTGQITSYDDHAAQVSAGGNVEVDNSGTLTSSDDPSYNTVRTGFSSIHAEADGTGTATVTNRVGGSVLSPDDYAVHLITASGNLTLTNDGTISGKGGVHVTSDTGSLQLTNNTQITATGSTHEALYVVKAGGGTIDNHGTLTGGGHALRSASAGLLTQVNNHLGGVMDGLIDLQGATSLANAGTLVLPANTVSAVNGPYTQSILGSNGLLRLKVNASAQFGKLSATGAVTLPAQARIEVVTADPTLCRGITGGTTVASVVAGSSVSASTFNVTDDCNGIDFQAVVNGNHVDLMSVLHQDGVCGSDAGQTLAMTPTQLCSAGTASTVTSSGGQYSWSCQGSGNPAVSASCSANWASTGPGSGSVTSPLPASNNFWVLTSASFQTTPPATPPTGVTFPQGLASLQLTSGTAGSDATVTIHYSQPIPAGAVYMKYGVSPEGYNCTGSACSQNHWYTLPADRAVFANDRMSVTLRLTDGGLGDNDGANSLINDPGGPALAPAVASVPTLGEWGLFSLTGLLVLLGARRACISRRQAS